METEMERWVREYRDDPEFIAEGTAIEFVEDALGILDKMGLNEAWLSEKTGIPPRQLSRILDASPNLTLLSISRISVALGATLSITLSKEQHE
jgi:DNA-binding phage protein